MEKLKFVDDKFRPTFEVSLGRQYDLRYAIDLGVGSVFAGVNLPAENRHFFVSAKPWVKNVDRKSAFLYLDKLKKANAGVEFGLLEMDQIEEINKRGNDFFVINNCWTAGEYSLKYGVKIVDSGQNSDVYFIFGFEPGKEKKVVLP